VPDEPSICNLWIFIHVVESPVLAVVLSMLTVYVPFGVMAMSLSLAGAAFCVQLPAVSQEPPAVLDQVRSPAWRSGRTPVRRCDSHDDGGVV